MNGVQEEIRHDLDSKVAKNGGKLTPQQMYEAIKKYKTYMAHNKRLEGKGASSSTSQQKAAGHTSGYWPWFHKTMAFAATMAESEDDGHYLHESSPHEGTDSFGAESSQEDDEGLFIPSYLEEALIDDELTTCLLDNGAQLNFITPAYAQERGMDIMSLDHLVQEIGGSIPPIRGIGSISVETVGFVMMNVKVSCVQGYDEDQIVIVMDDPAMSEWLVILGTPTIYWVMEVIKESEISKLAVPWASSRVSWLMRDVQARLGQVVVNDVANKPISPLNVDEVVRVASKCTVPPFGHKAIHGKVNLVLHGYKMNVMTHGLEKRSPSLPLGIDVQTVYATLADGSNRVTVVLRNNTRIGLRSRKAYRSPGW